MKGGFSFHVNLDIAPNEANNFDSVGTFSIIQSATIYNPKIDDFERRALISGNMLRHFLYEWFSRLIQENEEKWYLSEEAVNFSGYRYKKSKVKYYETANKTSEIELVKNKKLNPDSIKVLRDADVFGFMVTTGTTVRRSSVVYVSDLVGGKISTAIMSRNQVGIVAKSKNGDNEGAAEQQRITYEQASGIYTGGMRFFLGGIGRIEDTNEFVLDEAEQKLRIKYLLDAIESVYGHGNFGARRARKDIYIKNGEAIAVAVKGANFLPGYARNLEEAKELKASIEKLLPTAEVEIFHGTPIKVVEELRKFYGI